LILIIITKLALARFDFDCLTLALKFPWNVTELMMHRTYGKDFFVAVATAAAATVVVTGTAIAVVILIPPPTQTHVYVVVYVVYTYIYNCSSHQQPPQMCVNSTIR